MQAKAVAAFLAEVKHTVDMKLSVPKNLTAEDLPVVQVGLYHTVKSLAVKDVVLVNSVEYTMVEEAMDVFTTYITHLNKAVSEIT